MRFFEQVNNSLIFRENGETLIIDPCGDDGLRVRSTFLGEIEEGSIAILETECNTNVEIKIEDLVASISNGNITAKCEVNTWGNHLQITYVNQKDEVLIKEIPYGGALQKKARHFKPLAGGSYRLKASFEPNPGEKLYGMGQYQQEVMDLKGCNLELAHRNSQASVPFYISNQGYGFLWHNAAVGEVHFGSNTTEWIAESTKQLDYYIVAKDTPAQIEEAYTAVTGRAPMMPEYGLGFWQCKLRYYTDEEAVEVATKYYEKKIPVDVFVIDYYHWPKCGDWRFDEEYFPHPEEMIKKIKDMGMETMVSVWPQVEYNSENYQEMRQKGLLVRSNTGLDIQMLFHGNNVFFDATNPKAREYVWEKCKKNYADMGVNLFWLDEAEPEFTTYDFDNYRYAAGAVNEIGNIYPREYARTFYEGQKNMGMDKVVNLLRCAWVGSQRYGALVWSGDIMSTYEDFRKQICAGLHMGISGIPWWTTDIGGFHGGNINDPEFVELLLRWFQFGTFCPVMRIHGCRAPYTQIVDKKGVVREHTGAPNEIWSYGEEAEEIMTKFIMIRESMRDYTRSIMKDASENGNPVIRTVFYEFPEDEEAWSLTDEYFFGPDILVAPVCHKGARDRKVYLPKGATFTNAHTGEVVNGGEWIDVHAEIDTLPIFLREGRQDYLIGKI